MKTISAVLNDKICGIINTKGKVRIISKDNEDCEFKEYIQKESELERTRENIKYYKNKIAKCKGILSSFVSLTPSDVLGLVGVTLLMALIGAKSIPYFEELLPGIMSQYSYVVYASLAAFATGVPIGLLALDVHIKNKLVRKSCEKKLEHLKEKEKNQQEHLELLKLVIKYREYVLVKETSDGSAVYGDDEDLTKDQIRYANFHMTATLLKILRDYSNDKVEGNKSDNLDINNEEAKDILSKIDNLSTFEAIKRLDSGEEECIHLDLRDKNACK